MAEETPLRRLRSCPLAIICGKPEEIPIIAKKLQALNTISGASVEGVNNGHIFYLGKMRFKGDKILKFYVTSSLKQGLVHFSIYAGALISVLRPRFAIHTGVCAGNKNAKVELEHVICGDSAMSFEDGKWGMKNGQLIFMPDYETVTTTIAGIATFTADRETVHYGSYVSGSAVREDAAHIFEKIETTVSRKVLGLDMEASAFLKLCQHSQHTDVQSLGVIKGVSDLGDEKKGNDPVIYNTALENAGETVKDWISYWFRSMTWEPNEDDEPGAQLSKPYYQNFVRLVSDAISAGYPIKSIDDKAESPETIQPPIGLKIVMPPDDDVDFYAEQGQIERLTGTYNLRVVTVGLGSFTRTAYYKKRYLIDFPRNLNDLLRTDEPSYQALVFKRALQRAHYFKFMQNGTTIAEIMAWNDFDKMFRDTPDSNTKSDIVVTPAITTVGSE